MLESTDLSFSLNAAVCAFELRMEQGEDCSLAGLAEFLPSLDHPEYHETLVELVRVDLEYRWNLRKPRTIDDYLNQFPGLESRSECLNAVCFEEHRQKILFNQESNPEDYQSKYGVHVGGWRISNTPSRASNRSLNDERDKLDGMPSVGESFGGFELISELGRGSFARVFLARETALSNRLVALKVTRNRYSDSKTLARLQHTNIIPVYSVKKHGDWEAICMPYFGSLTCNQLLNRIRHQPFLPPSGEFIVDTVVELQKTTRRNVSDSLPDGGLETRAQDAPISPIETAQCYQELKGMTYVRSVLLIAKKLASGLSYAHARGIIHRDLKPANILLSDDGEPMLLDFNLSEDTTVQKENLQDLIGGTLPYMAPEQLASFGLQSRAVIDPRSDIFSFGIVLYELLAGKSPFPTHCGKLDEVIEQSILDRHQSYPPLLDHSSATTPAIDSIIAKCLAPKVEDRYQSAQQLCDDLERQLDNRPLAFALERSARERCQKWVRRHPRIVSTTSIAAVATVLLAGLLSVLAIRSEHIAGLELREKFRDFRQKLHFAESQLTSAPLGDNKSLDDTILACDSALEVFPWTDLQEFESSKIFDRLRASGLEELNRDIGELLFLKATTLGLKADFATSEIERNHFTRCALELNQQARSLCKDKQFSTSLDRQSRWLRGDTLSDTAIQTGFDSSDISVRTLAEQACLVSAQRRFGKASELWNNALLRDPKNLWLWYGLAYSLEQTAQLNRAAECYSACIALQPDNYQWYFQRGIVRIKNNEFDLAKSDFAKAAEINPNSPEIYLNRGIALLELEEFSQSHASVERAIELGFKDPQAYRLLAQVYLNLGDEQTAGEALRKAETTVPISAQSWLSRGVSKANTAPEDALADFDVALSLNAHFLPALESKASVLSEVLHRTEDAIRVLDEAIRLFPEAHELIAVRGVLHARVNHRAMALEDAALATASSDEPGVRYRVAGIFALLSTESPELAKQSLQLIASSLTVGYGLDLIATDPDLAPIRELPEFQRLRDAATNFQTMSVE